MVAIALPIVALLVLAFLLLRLRGPLHRMQRSAERLQTRAAEAEELQKKVEAVQERAAELEAVLAQRRKRREAETGEHPSRVAD